MKVKSEREVAQSCPTLSDPMECSLPGSSVHGIFQARVLEWGAIAFSEIIPSGFLIRQLEVLSTQKRKTKRKMKGFGCWIKNLNLVVLILIRL